MGITWNPEKDVYTRKVNGIPYYIREGVCLSTDEKPVICHENGKTIGVENGSQLHEMDSSKIKTFDIDNKQWHTFGEEESDG